jgi:NADH-quinone oxidoreductase subunit N
MTAAEVTSLAPEIVLTAAGVLILLLEAFAPALRRSFTALAGLATLAAAWASATLVPAGVSFGGLLEHSATTLFYGWVVLASTLLGLVASEGYLRREGILAGEYHALFLWCAAGLLLMLRATELLTIFVALETLSLALYALAAYHRRVKMGTEAAIKYFLMGAFASAFVLYGLALLYGQTGSTHLAVIGEALAGSTGEAPLAIAGVVMLIAGFGFKMSLVPFHAWSPDTYQGAPSPFVAFLSVAPKVASALVLLRVLAAAGTAVDWGRTMALLAVLSMVVGNLLALVQKDIKRMLAYSGIAHMGYLLIATVTLTPESSHAVLVYLAAYALMNAGAFAVIAVLYANPGEQHLISELSGWGYRFPWLGGALAVCMLSLGGIPPTFGFLGKYVVFLHAVAHGDLGLAIVGVATSLIGVFYYLRVVYTLYMRPMESEPVGVVRDAWGGTAAVVAALATLLLGILPGPILEWIWRSVPGS